MVDIDDSSIYDDCLQDVADDKGRNKSAKDEGKIVLFRPVAIGSTKSKYKLLGETNGLQFKMVKTENKLVKSILMSYGFSLVSLESPEFNVMWTGSHVKPFGFRSLRHYQRVNHFPRTFELTRKDRLNRNIERMQRLRKPSWFNFIPEFYVLPQEFERFKEVHFQTARLKTTWIVKPCSLSRGRGIYLVNRPEEIPLCDPVLVSKYINNPLLLNGHKFDIRLYVAVTSFHPLVAYLYSEGLARFATQKYNTNTQRTRDDVFVHLTNYSINKDSDHFERSKDPNCDNEGHKWSFSALLNEFAQRGIDVQLLMLRIEDLIVKTLISGQSAIAAACNEYMPYAGNCFEVFGFDILLDTALKPWLLEVNLSPSLSCDAPIDFKIKSKMVCDLLSLAGVPVHDSRSDSENSARQPEPLSSLTSKQRVQHACQRLMFEQKRAGAYNCIFPTPSSWMLYGDLMEEVVPNLDKIVHEEIFPKEHDNDADIDALQNLRDALWDTDNVTSVFNIPKQCRDLIPDAMKRALQYQQKRHGALKKVSMPRLRKFREMSSLDLRTEPELQFADESKDYIILPREMSNIYGDRPKTTKQDRSFNQPESSKTSLSSDHGASVRSCRSLTRQKALTSLPTRSSLRFLPGSSASLSAYTLRSLSTDRRHSDSNLPAVDIFGRRRVRAAVPATRLTRPRRTLSSDSGSSLSFVRRDQPRRHRRRTDTMPSTFKNRRPRYRYLEESSPDETDSDTDSFPGSQPRRAAAGRK